MENMSRFRPSFQGMLLACHTASGWMSMDSVEMLQGGNASQRVQGIPEILFPVPTFTLLHSAWL